MDTVEATDQLIKSQLSNLVSANEKLAAVANSRVPCAAIIGKASKAVSNNIEAVKSTYLVSTADTMVEYYMPERKTRDIDLTKQYYMCIMSENIQGRILEIVQLIAGALETAEEFDLNPRLEGLVNKAYNDLDAVESRLVQNYIERKSTEFCKCGTRFIAKLETAELWCKTCLKSKQMTGAQIKEDNNSDISRRSSTSGTDRHYKFWSDRIQAREKKTFTNEEIDKINKIIQRDGIDRTKLNCETMRSILKTTNLTYLNQNTSLLIKTVGGPPPPAFSFTETQKLRIKFKKIMTLYEQVATEGGNKPYYPYFIYKLYEDEFKDDPVKLRILDYIHLQSKDTVTKNDILYKRIEELSAPEDGIVYRPTVV
jgi:hypothetical protein